MSIARAACLAGCLTFALVATSHAQQAATSIPPMLAKPAAKAAQKPADKPTWSQLSPAQQTALEPLRAEWDPMEGVRKQKWLELANHFAAMKPDEQQRVHEKMRAWVKLTPDQRKLARQNYTQAKTIAPNEKSANWESYKQLPDETKQKLAEQATRKPLTNLPSAKAAQHGPAPILHGAPCPAGSVRNTASAAPACVAAAPAASTGIVTSAVPVK